MFKRWLLPGSLGALLFYSTAFASDPVAVPTICTTLADELIQNPRLQLKIIVGLGTLGAAYSESRNNIGYRVIDNLIPRWEMSQSFAHWTLMQKRWAHLAGAPDTLTAAEEIEGVQPVSSTERKIVKSANGFNLEEAVNFYTEDGTFRSEDGEVMVAKLGDNIVLAVRPFSHIGESGRFVSAVFNFFKNSAGHRLVSADDMIIVHDDPTAAPGKYRVGHGLEVSHHLGIESIQKALRGEDQNFYRLGVGTGKAPAGVSALRYRLAEPSLAEKNGLDTLVWKMLDSVFWLVQKDVVNAALIAEGEDPIVRSWPPSELTCEYWLVAGARTKWPRRF